MIENNYGITITFITYLIVMLLIGLYAYKRTNNSEDYFLGGRTLGPWPAALSAGASDMSGWLLLGLPGYAYVAGIEAFWLAGGLLIGTWLNWLVCAKRIRTYSITTDNALTLPEFLSRRFNDKSKLIQSISAFFILMFFLFYTSSGLVAGGKLFETVFGLNYQLAVFIGAACVVSYTLFGGFLAVAWTDLVQGLLMSAALLIVPIAALQDEGGFVQLAQGLYDLNPNLLSLWKGMDSKPLSWIAIMSLVTWGLGYFGQPHIMARFNATRSNADLVTARRIAVIWTALSMAGALLVGLVGLLYVQGHETLVLVDGEKIFMLLVNAIFHPLIAGILLAAILAAIMSTADSQLLVSSSALAEDFYKNIYKPNATSKEVMLVGRIGVVVLSLIALFLAMDPDSSVLGLVSYAWAGFGAAFGPTLIFSLYWKRMNRNGAVAGILVGGFSIIIWKQISGGLFDLYEILPGIIFACIAIVGVSLLTKKPDEKVLVQFEQYKKNLQEFA